MNRPLLLQSHLQAIPPRKRRYSSTAVGFPIRYDLSAHSQGISEGFPSGERARHAPTYVCPHAITNDSSSNPLSSTMQPPYQSATSAAPTPSGIPKKCPFAACLLPGLPWRKPLQQAGVYTLTTHEASPSCSRFTCSSLGNHLKSCKVLDTSVLCTFSPLSVHVQSTFSPRSVHVQSTFSPRSVHVQSTFSLISELSGRYKTTVH